MMFRKFREGKVRVVAVLGAVALAAVLIGARAASSADLSGPTIIGEVCMQTTFSGQTAEPVPNSDKLNCTANDIRIARALQGSLSPTSCIAGTLFDLTATFEVNVTANSRYDAGFYFNIDGGANARLGGTCSLSVLDPELIPGLDLDGGDFCGDLNAGTYFATFTIPDVLCQAQPGTNFLRLPNCTAWHSNSSTLCTENTEADPDTKSKCACDDNFTVPVIVETASLLVTKTATPTSVPETGGTVTYTVQVTNQSIHVDVTIGSVVDCIAFDPQGNCTQTVDLTTIPVCGASQPNLSIPFCTPANVTSCASLIGVTLQEGGGNASCSFQAFVTGNPNQTLRDVVEVCTAQQGTGATICDEDDAEVTVTDVSSTPSLTKTAQSAACTAVDVTYQVVVNNPSAVDTLTVNSLTDSSFGDITQAPLGGSILSTTCATGGTIQPQGNYTCSFVGRLTSATCDFLHNNIVEGIVTDDDGVISDPSDGASVSVKTVLQ